MAGTGEKTLSPSRGQYKTFNFEVPCEGAKTLPLSLDLATFAEVDIDLSQLVDNAQMSMVQTLFIDNSANAAALLVIVDPNGVNQSIVANPNTQGYYPILLPNPALLQFLSQGGVVVRVQLINVPIAGVVWAATHP